MIAAWRKRDERGMFAALWKAINELGAYCDSLRVMSTPTVQSNRTNNGTALLASAGIKGAVIEIAAQVNEGTEAEPDWVWKKVRVFGTVLGDAGEAGAAKWS